MRVLARLATRRGGRVALMVCGGERELVLPPRGGRGAGAAVERILRAGVVPDGQRRPALPRARARPGWGGWRACPGWWSWCRTSAAGRSWAGRCARSAARHSVAAIEVRDPREAALPAVGRLRVVDPETGAQVEVDTRDRAPARALRRPRARGAGGRAAPAAPRRAWTTWCSPRTALAARPRRPAQGAGRPAAGELPGAALPALPSLAVPLALGAYALARRRRRRYAVRFTGAPTLAALVDAVPAWRRHLPAALFAAALAALALALARPQATVAVPIEQASVLLVTDVSGSMQADRRGADPAGRGAQGRARVPRGRAGRGARGRGGLLHGSAHPRPPRHRPLRAWRSSSRT